MGISNEIRILERHIADEKSYIRKNKLEFKEKRQKELIIKCIETLIKEVE